MISVTVSSQIHLEYSNFEFGKHLKNRRLLI